MSHQFTIDGIEEVFREDVMRLIVGMRQRLVQLLSHPDDPAALEDVRGTGHSMKGTTSLVGLNHLSRCGALIERMAEVAGSLVRTEPEEARSIYRAMEEGLVVVERLLEECLRRSPDAVQQELYFEVCRSFPVHLRAYIEGYVEPADEPAPVVAAPVESAPPAAAGVSSEDEFAKELAEVFALELQEQLENVPGELGRLAVSDTRMAAANRLNRIFHTIKGSAAMVGLKSLSETAKRMEKCFGDPDTLTEAALRAAQSDIEAIFSSAGLPAPSLVVSAEQAMSESAVVAKAASELALERELLEAFNIDAAEAIERSEQLLLELEHQPDDRDRLQALFRQFHTLKGAAGAVGLDVVAGQLHQGESLLESVVEGEVAVEGGRLVDFLFRLMDSIVGLINQVRGIQDPKRRIITDVEDAVASLLVPAEEAAPVAVAAEAAPTAEALVVPAGAMAQETEAGVVRVQAGRLDALLNQVGQLVVTRTRMDQKIQSFADLRGKLEYCRTRLTDAIETFQKRFEFTLGDAPVMPPMRAPDAGDRSGSAAGRSAGYGPGVDDVFTDLEFDKYDDFNILARSVIELATDTGEVADQLDDFMEALGEEVRQFSKITSGLQRQITNLRLVPIDVVFRRLLRPVRDAARQEGKLVKLDVQGGEVQLDRSVIDALYPPLLHIVRNAVSHGVESPGVREVRGKPHTGTIRITAVARHNSVTLAVGDDGAGIDYQRILQKAVALNLVDPANPPGREQLLSFIFRSGFSTQEEVTDLAGRGVGMDVVARQVAALNGSVLIDSREGQGTTVRLALPITTSIDEVLTLDVGEQVYALPVDFVDRVVPVDREELVQDGTSTLLPVGEERVPALFLAPLVGEPVAPGNAVAVVLRAGERVMALVIDRVRTQQEVVIRPLNRVLAAHPFLSGATISGGGDVIFILHAGRLFELLGLASDQWMAVEGLEAVETRPMEGGAARAVLVVDDSISVRKLAVRFLESEAIEVDAAVDGLDALEKLSQKNYRVVVTDLEMPRMHGYELVEAIKTNPEFAHVPVIVCTSRSSDKHRQRAKAAGADGYITKPFSKEELLGEINRVTTWRTSENLEARGTGS